MLVRPRDSSKPRKTYDAAVLLEKARAEETIIREGKFRTIDLEEVMRPEKSYTYLLLFGLSALVSVIIILMNAGIGPVTLGICAIIAFSYSVWAIRFSVAQGKVSAVVRQLNEHRDRVLAHNNGVRERRAQENRAQIEAARREAERTEQREREEAQKRRDEVLAQKKRESDMFFNEYVSFEGERQRRAQLVYLTAPLIRAFWSDYLALADLAPTPFNPEKDFRQYFWELFNEATGTSGNKVDAMKCIHEISDPLLQQPIAYIKADLPPRWPPLIPSPDWTRLKSPSIPLDAPMRELRATVRDKPGSLPLYLDTL